MALPTFSFDDDNISPLYLFKIDISLKKQYYIFS